MVNTPVIPSDCATANADPATTFPTAACAPAAIDPATIPVDPNPIAVIPAPMAVDTPLAAMIAVYMFFLFKVNYIIINC